MASELRHPDQNNTDATCLHTPVCWFLERGPCKSMRDICKSYIPCPAIDEAFDYMREKYGHCFDGIDAKKFVDELRGNRPDNNSQKWKIKMNGQKKLVKFFDCDCSREALRIEKDDDTGLFFFGFYEQPNPWSFWEKVKYCWKFMRTSHQFKDTLIFRPNQAKNIANWLNEICKEELNKSIEEGV